MSRIRLRQKQLIMAGGVGALVMLLIAASVVYWGFKSMMEARLKERAAYEQRLKDAEKLLAEQNAARQDVWVPKSDLKAGQEITPDDLSVISLPKALLPDNLVGKEFAEGKFTKIDVRKNTPIVASMLFAEGITPRDLRNQEFKLITLPSSLKKDDFVDVRIKFPTGQDYIVLSKKKVKDLSNGTVWHELDELEILTMSGAIVDAFIQDATIYALSYVDPYMQDKALVTYTPNEKVMSLIASDPNVLREATLELERRKRQQLESDLAEMPERDRGKFVSRMNNEASGSAGALAPRPDAAAGEAQQPYPPGDNAIPANAGQPQPQSAPSAPPVLMPPSLAPSGGATLEEQEAIFGSDTNDSVEVQP